MSNKDLALLLAGMAAMSPELTKYNTSYPLSGIDIDNEWELIQQKKSKLSSRLRKMITELKLKANRDGEK